MSILHPSPVTFLSGRKVSFQTGSDIACGRNIEMAPLYQIEMTLLQVSGSREKRHDGAVDEQAGIQAA
jgi:hypothetical protein